jgi:hypothetical protein
LDGARLHFSFINAYGQLKTVQAHLQGASLTGEVLGPYGMVDVQPEIVKISGQLQRQ